MTLRPGTWAYAVVLLAGLPALADEVPTADRDRIQDNLSTAFVRPQLAIWHFDGERTYIGADRLVCGWVNFQSAQQTYVGYHQFYAIVRYGKVTLAQIDDPVSDTSGKLAEKLKGLCGMNPPPKSP